eukprot:5286698-Pyramimonas_sp.AAC.1
MPSARNPTSASGLPRPPLRRLRDRPPVLAVAAAAACDQARALGVQGQLSGVSGAADGSGVRKGRPLDHCCEVVRALARACVAAVVGW